MTRTLEQALKFDHGLTIGVHLVEFDKAGAKRLALIEIGARGAVYGMAKPNPNARTAGWDRIRGDVWVGLSGVASVWPARDAAFMARFDGEPAARISL